MKAKTTSAKESKRIHRSVGGWKSLLAAGWVAFTLTQAEKVFATTPTELPTGGVVTSGSANIATSGATMNINQSTDRAIINWTQFNVGSAATVNFNQPSSSSQTLNRVTSSDASQIFGTINANGQVYLINPNGVIFGSTAQVNAAGFAASTLDITDENFLAGKGVFERNGATGEIVNEGKINVAPGGLVALMAARVKNQGTIAAPDGNVVLAAGEKVQIPLTSSGLVTLDVSPAALDTMIENSGGVIEAKTVQAAARTIDMGGVVSANSKAGDGGNVTLAAEKSLTLRGTVTANGKNGGTITAVATNGTLDVMGLVATKGLEGRGGTIRLSGKLASRLHDGAQVLASGQTGGGSVWIGGGPRGLGDLLSSETASVAAGVTLKADALENGDGGEIIVWSDGLTQFAGQASARGGVDGGNGGQAEVSGAYAKFLGTVDLRAPKGSAGELLLDPVDFTIAASGGDTTGAAVSSQLELGNLTILSSNGASGTTGNINVNDAISWNSAYRLTLSAAAHIYINTPITGEAGGLTLTTGSASYNSYVNANVRVNSLIATYNTILTQNEIAKVTLTGATPSLTIAGNAYTLISTVAEWNAMTLGNTAVYYALNADIGTVTTILGPTTASYFRGKLEGLGHLVTVDITGAANYVGAFGYSTGAVIRNIGVAGNVNGETRSYVGGLMGLNGGTIVNSYSMANVVGGTYVGGLAGSTTGNLTGSYATGTVSGTTNVGGLAGYQTSGGTTSNSYATGNVTGTTAVGGLMGYMYSGTITGSYATGVVTGTTNVGGLVGHQNTGTVTNSYASATVSGTTNVGGLVGYFNNTTISNSYATGSVSGTTGVGGLIGAINLGTVTNSYWDKASTGQSVSAGGTGLTTAELKSALQTGFSSSVWGIVAGSSYPYLLWQETPKQMIAGLLETGLSGETVRLVVGGAVIATTTTQDDGRFSFLLDAQTIGLDSAFLIYVDGGAVQANAVYQTGSMPTFTVKGITLTSGLIGVKGAAGQTLVLNDTLTTVKGGLSDTDILYETGDGIGLSGDLSVMSYGDFYLDSSLTGSVLNVTLRANQNLYVNAALSGLGSVALTAGRAIYVNAPITSASGSLTLTTGSANYNSYINADVQVNTLVSAYNTLFTKNGTATVELIGVAPGLTIAGNAYTLINTVDDWNAMVVNSTAVYYALNADIGTVEAIKGTGVNASSYFKGMVDGLGHIVTVNITGTANYVGAFGYIYGATIRNIGVAGAVDGGIYNSVGGLAGYMHVSSKIENSYSTASVSGAIAVGGLVGYLYTGAVTDSFATGAVNGNTDVGGLIGHQVSSGTITRSYATTNVMGETYVGGLVGFGGGVTTDSFAAGNVSGTNQVGGLIGYQVSGSAVTNSFATGRVTGSTDVGGLVGFLFNGTITSSYATGHVSGTTNVGGLVGLNGSASYSTPITDSYALGIVKGETNVGGLVGSLFNGTITTSYAAGLVSGTASVGGLVGSLTTGTVTNSYWDTENSGQLISAGGTGLTTTELKSALPTGFSSSIWGVVAGKSYPYLLWQGAPLYYAAGQVSSGLSDQVVRLAINGVLRETTVTSVGGAYSFGLASGSLNANDVVLIYIDDGSSQGSTIFVANDSYTLSGITLTTNTVKLTGAASTALNMTSVLKTAIGSLADTDILYSTTPTSVNVSGNLNVTAYGAVSQTDALVVSGVTTIAAPGYGVTLTNSGNLFTGALNISNSALVSLVNGRATALGSIVSVGDVFIQSTGNLALGSGNNISSSGGDVVLVADGGHFTNNSTSGAITAGGDWTIYTASPTGDSYNGLVYNYVQYDTSYGDALTGTGNGYIYADPLSLSVSVAGTPTKVYDRTTTATVAASDVTLSGLTGGSYTFTVSSAAYDTANAGTGKTVTVNISLTGVTDNNGKAVYGLDSTLTGTNTSGVITKADLSLSGVTANDKVYDGTTIAGLNTGVASLVGVIAGDVVGLNSASAAGSFADKNVGDNKAVTVSGFALTGAGAGNYTLTQPTGLTADITPATLTISNVTANDKVYNGTTAATLNMGSASLAGVVVGDVVSLNSSAMTASFADKNVGNDKAVTVGGFALTGAGAGNYTLTQPTGLTADITPATLTISNVTANDKVYDGTTAATLNIGSAGLAGVIGADVVGLNSSAITASFANKNVGNDKAVTVSGFALTGAGAGNYTLTQPTGLTADITAATLTVSGVMANDKVYDGTTVAVLNTGAASLVGVVGGDAVGLNSAAAAGSFADKNVEDDKVVTVGGFALTGAGAGNYILTQPTGLTADITLRTISYSVADSASVSGTMPAYGSVTWTNAVGGDNLSANMQLLNSGLVVVVPSTALAAGTYTQKVVGLAGGDSLNYQLAAVGNHDGVLTVSAPPNTNAGENNIITPSITKVVDDASSIWSRGIETIVIDPSQLSGAENKGLPLFNEVKNRRSSVLALTSVVEEKGENTADDLFFDSETGTLYGVSEVTQRKLRVRTIEASGVQSFFYLHVRPKTNAQQENNR